MNLERRWLGQVFSQPAPATREEQLEQMLQAYYDLLRDYDEYYYFRISAKERAALQQRAKRLLEGK